MRTPLREGPSDLLSRSQPLVRCINRHDLKNVVPNTVPPVCLSIRPSPGGMTDEIILLMRLLASFR